jgi:hypothetical protein
MYSTVSRFVVAITVSCIGSPGAQTTGWPDTTGLLAREKSQATACVALSKSVGNNSTILEGQIDYENAKTASDGAIAAFETALAEGGKPRLSTSA